jgi:hypothetical protein
VNVKEPTLSRSKVRRLSAFAEELLQGAVEQRYTTLRSLPANFWRMVLEIEDAGWHWPPIYRAMDAHDAKAAARAAREAALYAVATFAGIAASGRASGGRAAAKARRAKGVNTITLIEIWEREKDRRLTPRSAPQHIALCANNVAKSEATVRNVLYRRERGKRSRQSR